MKKSILVLFVLFTGLLHNTFAQEDSLEKSKVKKEALKFNLSDDGSKFFQVTFLNQTWLRYNESNPGTLVNNAPVNETFDVGLRRTRIQMFGQLTDNVFVYFQFGQNNFNSQYNYSGNRKVAAFFHDALTEYKVTKGNQLKLGGGLTITNGLSRFSQPSIGTILSMDVPVFAQATVDQTDEFSRKLSIYARGQIGKIDYRVSLSDPFPINSNGSTPPAINSNAVFSQKAYQKQMQAYVAWQFFDHEPHTTPYMTGTYLGSKKVFNIAGGVIAQPQAMWYLENGTDTTYHNMLLWCVESYLDMPLNKAKGTAISAYAGYFNYDYGRNYLRFNGLMNPAMGSNATNVVTGAGPTFGNAYPMFGTGNVFYAQVGYLLPKQLLGEKGGQLLPYVTWIGANYDRLGQPMNVFDAGVNWLINKHKAKMSLNYQSRPTYVVDSNNEIQTDARKSCWVLQYQIYI